MPFDDIEPPANPISAPADWSAAIPVARPIAWPVVAADSSAESALLLLDSTRRDAWMDMAFIVAGLLLADVLTGVILVFLVGEGAFVGETLDPDVERSLNIAGVGIRAVAVMSLIAVVVMIRGQSCRSVGLDRRRLGMNLLVGAIAPAAVGCAILCLNVVLALAWPAALKQMQQNAGRLTEMIPRMNPLTLGAMMTVVGIYEELLFRGFLMPRMRRALGNWPAAVVVTTIVFTLLHAFEQTPVALIPICLLSLTFSLITIWRKSLIPAIVAHALFNFSVVMILYLTAGDAWQ